MRSLGKCTPTIVFFFFYLQLAPCVSNAAPLLSSSWLSPSSDRAQADGEGSQLVRSSPLSSPFAPTAWAPELQSYGESLQMPPAAQAAVTSGSTIVLGGTFLGLLVISLFCCCKLELPARSKGSVEAESVTRSDKVARVRGFPSPPTPSTITARSTPLDFKSLRLPPARAAGQAKKAWNWFEDGDLVAVNRYSKLYRVAMSQEGQGAMAMKQVDLDLPVHCSGVCTALEVLAAQAAEMHRNVMWPAGFVSQGKRSLVLLYREWQMANGTLRDLLRPGCRCQLSGEGGAESKPVDRAQTLGDPTLLRSYQSMLEETFVKCLKKVSSRPCDRGGQVDAPDFSRPGQLAVAMDEVRVTVQEEKLGDGKSDGLSRRADSSPGGGMSSTGGTLIRTSAPRDLQLPVENERDPGQYLRRMVEAYGGHVRPQSGSETETSLVSSSSSSRCTTTSWMSLLELDSTTVATAEHRAQPPRNGVQDGFPWQKLEVASRHLDSVIKYSASPVCYPADLSISRDLSPDWDAATVHHAAEQDDLTRRKGSLSHDEVCNVLTWERRFRIALGLARAIAYLHYNCSPPITHIDITSSNVCIDDSFEAMLGDAELSTLLDPNKSIQPDGSLIHVCGSVGYTAPEYDTTRLVTCKSNVYSFGVVLLEMLTARQADEDFGQGHNNLVSWVRANASSHAQYHDSAFILDARITADTSSVRHMLSVLRIAMKCLHPSPTRRPDMAAVVEFLERSDSRSMLYS